MMPVMFYSTRYFRRLTAFLGLWLTVLAAYAADVVVLHTGQRIQGDIVLQNEQVVMVRTAAGQRFQVAMNEVEAILADSAATALDTVSAQAPAHPSGNSRVALRLTATVGAALIPHETTGSLFAAEAAIGAGSIAGHRIFLGGSIGYIGCMAKPNTHFLPLQISVSVPLRQQTHAPEIGASFGYGVGLKRHGSTRAYGGLTGSVSLAWRWQWQKKNALLIGAVVRFQQSKNAVTETIDGTDYTSLRGCCYILPAAQIAVQF